MLAALDVIAGISWNPEIRNILSLLVGTGVLIGSVYLIVSTNTGIRTGMLIILAGLFGWMTGMGAVWWMYGIGMVGESPSWVVQEINYDLDVAELDEARDLSAARELPSPQAILEDRPELAEQVIPEENPDKILTVTLGELIEADPDLVEELGLEEGLGGWELLPISDRQRGDAAATADAALGAEGEAIFETSAEYSVRDAFSIGGKPPRDGDGLWDRAVHKLSTIWHWSHPTRYAVVQVQQVVPPCEEGQTTSATAPCVEVVAGEAPPAPELLEGAPLISVIMVRDLGDKRFPAAMVTLSFGGLFALTCYSLHRRDKLTARARSTAPA